MSLANLPFVVWIAIPASASLMTGGWPVVNAPRSMRATAVNATVVPVTVATKASATLICSVSVKIYIYIISFQ